MDALTKKAEALYKELKEKGYSPQDVYAILAIRRDLAANKGEG